MSWATSELRMRFTRRETGLSPPPPLQFNILLTVPMRCFFCGSFMLFLSCFCFAFICLLMPCGHLLGKGWPLGSRLWCLIVKLSLSHWYPGSGVVLDCIDSWSVPPFLFCRVSHWTVALWWWWVLCILYGHSWWIFYLVCKNIYLSNHAILYLCETGFSAY